MIESHIKSYCDEKPLDNPNEPIESRNKTKITLRKNKLNKEIQNKRLQYLEQTKLDLKTNINPQYKLKIKTFEESYTQILSYLNSNNIDFISYALNELRIYFFKNSPNIIEQKIIINSEFFNILLKLGYIFIKGNFNNSKDFNINRNKDNLIQILWILINIQVLNEGSGDFLKILYSKEYLDFYNDSLNFGESEEFFNSIKWILKSLIYNNIINISLQILRSDFFSKILDYYEKEDKIEINDNLLTLEIIIYSVNLSGQEQNLVKKDISIIHRCLEILMEKGYCQKDEAIIFKIYQGIWYITDIDYNYYFHKIILDNFVVKIMSTKFHKFKKISKYVKIVVFATRILANLLTQSDKNCEIIYSLNIIDYYNNLLEKFDYNEEIITNIFVGLSNISVGKNRKIILNSNIWDNNNLQKYLNLNDEIKKHYIKIIKFLIMNSDFEVLKFIYNTKILEYFIIIFNSANTNQKKKKKILTIIDRYLKRFKDKEKQSEEFLIIFHKFYDLFISSDKINLIECQDIISEIKKNLNGKYQ